MNIKLKITQLGNSLGVILPKEITTVLNVSKGDTVTASLTPNGVQLSPYDPDIERQLELGREIAKKYRETLRALAK